MRRIRRSVAALAVGMLVALGAAGPTPSYAATAHGDSQACLPGSPPASSSMPAPFLKLPFRARDGVASLYDSQGWLTSPDELAYDDEVNGAVHGANDLELLRQRNYGYGLPIVAAASGRAYFSYQYISGSWTDKAGAAHQVGWGAGLFVEIRHSQDTATSRGWVTQYIHLSKVAPGIPYLKPEAVDDPNDPAHPDWYPAGIVQDDDTLWNYGVPVTQGQIIGYQGDTGIGLDWKDAFNPDTGQVAERSAALKPWDPPQLHLQLYQGRVNGAKQNIVDPFGFYGQACPGEWKSPGKRTNPYTPFPGVVRTVPHASAFVLDGFGQPEYAAQ